VSRSATGILRPLGAPSPRQTNQGTRSDGRPDSQRDLRTKFRIIDSVLSAVLAAPRKIALCARRCGVFRSIEQEARPSDLKSLLGVTERTNPPLIGSRKSQAILERSQSSVRLLRASHPVL
jgi:hypothetical protein